MSREWQEGFDEYAQSNMSENGWQNPGGLMVAGRFGGQAWESFNNAQAVRTLPAGSLNGRAFGIAVIPAGNINANADLTDLFRISDGGANTATTQLQFTVLNGKLVVIRGVNGSGGTTIFTQSTGPTILSGLWYYIEVQVTISTTIGTLVINISDGTTSTNIANLTGLNTQNTANNTFDTIWLIGKGTNNLGGGVGQNTYDDAYFNTLTGGINNTLEGESRVLTIGVASNGHIVQWTPLASTNASQIDETLVDNDVSYNSSTVVGNLDMFVANTLVVTGPISAIQVCVIARKDDVGARSISTVIYDGVTDFVNATAYGLFSSYTEIFDVYETDPSTGLQWTQAIFNARQFGYKHIV